MYRVKERQGLPPENKASQKKQGKTVSRVLETLCFCHGFRLGSECSLLKAPQSFTSVTAFSSIFVFSLSFLRVSFKVC